jgi:hypothetical protein
MRPRLSLLPVFASFLIADVGASSHTNSNPIVNLPYGSFQGKVVGNTEQFLGMPYAAPPYVVIFLCHKIHT